MAGGEGGASEGGTAGNGVFGAGLKVCGPNGYLYMLNEDWPRQGDATGDTYRCIRRDPAGNESIVAMKVAKSALNDNGSRQATASTQAAACSLVAGLSEGSWNQEVRLLRRLALLGGATSSSSSNGSSSRSNSSNNLLGGAKTTTTMTTSSTHCPPAYTIEMVTEFGGFKTMPSLRFLVTTPVCWKSLDARVKGAERGYMEAYSAEQVRFVLGGGRGEWVRCLCFCVCDSLAFVGADVLFPLCVSRSLL